MTTVQVWTGQEARALRRALRLSVRDFASHLGVASRTVNKWEAKLGGTVPRPEMQAVLDTALQRAPEEVRQRFEGMRRGSVPEALANTSALAAEELVANPATESGLMPESVLVQVRIEGRDVLVPADPLFVAAQSLASLTSGMRRPGRRLTLTSTTQIGDVIEHLRDQWHLLVKTDNLFGPRYALHGVHNQIAIIEDLLVSTRERARREIVKLGAQYAESAAWLHDDAGSHSLARYWTSRAMEWAQEADDRLMVAWTMFRRSQQATISRDAAHVIGLAEAARRDGDLLPAPMRAAISQQEAHGHALDGNELVTQCKLDEAHQWAATDTKGDARGGHGSFCTASYIELQRAGCWLLLSQPKRAIQFYEQALPSLPSVYRRDRGLALSRCAIAYAALREPEPAAALAHEALAIARSVGSTRTLTEVVSVSQQLKPFRQVASVATLLDDLAELS